jgi:hypothetical protein
MLSTASPPWAAVRRLSLGAPKRDWMRGKRESSCRHVTDVGELPYSQLRRATKLCASGRQMPSIRMDDSCRYHSTRWDPAQTTRAKGDCAKSRSSKWERACEHMRSLGRGSPQKKVVRARKPPRIRCERCDAGIGGRRRLKLKGRNAALVVSAQRERERLHAQVGESPRRDRRKRERRSRARPQPVSLSGRALGGRFAKWESPRREMRGRWLVRAYTCSHRSPALAARVARAERFTFVAPNELRVPTSDASFPAHPRDAPHRVASLRIVRVDAIGT